MAAAKKTAAKKTAPKIDKTAPKAPAGKNRNDVATIGDLIDAGVLAPRTAADD